MKNKLGFTLIEAIIYTALLGLIMGGILPTVYQILQGSGNLSGRDTVQEEGNFVLRKIDWALTGIDPTKPITPPSSYGNSLSLTKYDGTTVDVQRNGTKIEMRENAASYLPITTDNVSVSNLQFHYLTPSGTGPAGIEASTTINGIVFYTKKYIRQ